MKAKDTVMSDEQITKVVANEPKSARRLIAEAQAEVSFKVGMGKGRDDTMEQINQMLRGTGLHLCWYTEKDEVISYGLADEHGDEVDVESVICYKPS